MNRVNISCLAPPSPFLQGHASHHLHGTKRPWDVLLSMVRSAFPSVGHDGPMASIAVVGLGPVGLVTAIAFAREGHDVLGLEADPARRTQISAGRPPLYEPGLEAALPEALQTGRLRIAEGPRGDLASADAIFLCVGTPSRADGSMDDTFLCQAAQDIAAALPKDRPATIVVKSTVVPGTTEAVVKPILDASRRPYGLAVNPEFLREGRALADALHPDRIVLGVDGRETATALHRLFANAECPILETDLRTAEAIKYATNAFLATKVAFANELANVCQALGVSYDQVIGGVKLDPGSTPASSFRGWASGAPASPRTFRPWWPLARPGATPRLSWRPSSGRTRSSTSGPWPSWRRSSATPGGRGSPS